MPTTLALARILCKYVDEKTATFNYKLGQPTVSMQREQRTQAPDRSVAYLAAVPEPADPDSMLYWLTRTCRERRELGARLQVHVAASLNRNQSTIDRFEEGVAWPRNAVLTVAAYADDLNIASIDLWQEALRRWQRHQAGEDLSELSEAAAARKQRDETKPRPARNGRGRRQPR